MTDVGRAFVEADPARRLQHPSGDPNYEAFVCIRLGELVIHGWDIATAAGLDPTLDPEVVDELWHRAQPHRDRLLQAFGRETE